MAQRKIAGRRVGWSDGAIRRVARVQVERLEARCLLAVTAGEYASICSAYPGFNLPASMASINIIEITPDQLGVASLKNAITTAGSTALPDLVVLRTTDTQNTITYASSADAVSIDISSAQGAISVVGFGSKPLTIDAANQSRVISVGSANSTTTVNLGGVTLTRGYASSGNRGGGISQSYGALNLMNVTISENSAYYGGGVYQYFGTLNLTSVTISENTASSYSGGGVYLSYGTSALTNVTISGNTASSYFGGGVFQNNGTSALTNVTISGNTADVGGGVYQSGGTSALTNVTMSGNSAYYGGGGACLDSGTLTLTNVTISGNWASFGSGGGVCQSNGTLTVTNVTISGNLASGGGCGGGVYQSGGTSSLTNVTISGNTAYAGGGACLDSGTSTLTNVTISGNVASGDRGGGVFQNNGTLALTNSTISGNTASEGGGVYLYSGTSTLRNMIVARNAADYGFDVYRDTGATLSGSNNLIGDGSGQTSLVDGRNGNLVGSSASPIDPQFVNMAGTDWTKWDMHLQATSPAVNAGDNVWVPTGVTTDIAGSARIIGGTVDMGAYELDHAPTVTAVYVRGSSWNTDFLSFLQANVSGSSSTYGFAIPVGSGAAQLQTLPWRNLNRISIAFSEDVSVAQAQFAIVGSVGSYSVSGFSYDATDHVATWSLSAVIGADKLYVALPGSGATPVTDVAGNALDGEWTNPTSFSQVGVTSIFPSGNGVAGGDFAFRFDVLPGDSTGGSLGKVNVADINQTKSRSALPETISSYRSDFDGNDLVNVADINYVKTRSAISSLPVNPPVLPSFGPVFSQVSLLQRDRSLTLW